MPHAWWGDRIGSTTWEPLRDNVRHGASSRQAGYSITSSARIRNDGGMEMPSAFAVLRFRISSNLVGRITGK